MPKLSLDAPLPLMDMLDAETDKKVFRAVAYNDPAEFRAALRIVLPMMRRAFPAGAPLEDLICVVDHASVDACHAELSFVSPFNDEVDTYCVYFPGRPNATLHRRHITKAVEWTGTEWRRVA